MVTRREDSPRMERRFMPGAEESTTSTPGTSRSISATLSGVFLSSSCLSRTVTEAGLSCTEVSVRVPMTAMVSSQVTPS